jgi:hypothetical protein
MLKTVSTANGLISPTFSGDVTLSNGNLVIGTSGKGIDFSATPGTGTSELLSDYEEGTFTPTWSGGSVTVNQSRYTKIGRQVTWIFDLTFGVSVSSSDSTLTLPFAVGSVWGAGSVNFTDISSSVSINIDGTASQLLLRSAINSANISCVTVSTKRIIGVASYFA